MTTVAPTQQQAPPVQPATTNQIRAEQLIFSLWNDPEYGPKIREAAKKQFGDIKTLEDDPVVGSIKSENENLKKALDEVRARLNKRDEEDEQAKTFRQMEEAVSAAQRKFGLTDEGRAKMLDRMKETKNFGDPEAAAAWVSHSSPPETPKPTWSPTKLNLFGSAEVDESYRTLHTNPDKYLDDQLTEFVRDPDKYVAETFGRAA